MALNLANDHVWINKKQYDIAETQYYESLTKDLIINKRNEMKCNGDVNEILHNSVNENPQGKSKKSTKNKNKINALPTNANCIEEESTAAIQQDKSKVKKNKKKNKSHNNKEDVDASSLHCNNFSSRKQSNAPLNESKRGTTSNSHCTLVSEIAKAREHIKNSLEKMDGMASIGGPANSSELLDRISAVEKENADLKRLIENLKNLVLDSQKRIAALEGQKAAGGKEPAKIEVPAKKSEADDDDGVDLFASDSDEESAEAARIREERLAAYAAKKSKKPVLIAKSNVILDVKPWDDETDLKQMEAQIRTITADGLLWGASKFVPVAFGIQKLSISCVVEDDKVSIDWLTEEIEKFEDFVQSVDVAAFNKI